MSSFVVDLWESIFTPGPTPSLLRAANLSFAALQLVLLVLLLATYNIHCAVLSVLCAGLWWSVNWFAAELAIQKAREAAEKPPPVPAEDSSSADETEVEAAAAPPEVVRSDVEPVEAVGEVKQRLAAVPAPGTQSSVSTEDEWEKVSENENEKDK